MPEDTQSARASEIQSCWLQEPTPLPAKLLWGLPGWPLLCTPAYSYTKCTLPLSWWEQFYQEGHDDPYLPVWTNSLPAAEWNCHGPPVSAEWGHSQIPGMIRVCPPLSCWLWWSSQITLDHPGPPAWSMKLRHAVVALLPWMQIWKTKWHLEMAYPFGIWKTHWDMWEIRMSSYWEWIEWHWFQSLCLVQPDSGWNWVSCY